MTLPHGEAARRAKERARMYQREKRASMSAEEKAKHLEKERERGRARSTDPTKNLVRSNWNKRTRAKRISDGICLLCNDLATCGPRCFRHWVWSVGRTYGLTTKNGGVEILQELWAEQNGLCALTGEKLIPDHNASIDHIVPRCRNGGHEKNNLQWVTKKANGFKSARNNEELIRMCVKIAQYAGRIEKSNVIPFFRKLSTASEG